MNSDVSAPGTLIDQCSAATGGCVYVSGAASNVGGGGLSSTDTRLRVRECSATLGGGVALDQGGSVSSMLLDTSTASSAAGAGVAVLEQTSSVGTSVISDCRIGGLSVSGTDAAGGCVHVGAGAEAQILGSRLDDCRSEGVGGHVFAAGSVSVVDSELVHGLAASGGCVAVPDGGVFTANTTLFRDCAALADGGAIYAVAGSVTLDTVSLFGNAATARGGAAYTERSAFVMARSTVTGFLDNVAARKETYVGTLIKDSITHSAQDGGALYIKDEQDSVSISSSEITLVSSGSSAVVFDRSTALVWNSVFQHSEGSDLAGCVLAKVRPMVLVDDALAVECVVCVCAHSTADANQSVLGCHRTLPSSPFGIASCGTVLRHSRAVPWWQRAQTYPCRAARSSTTPHCLALVCTCDLELPRR